MYEYLLYVYVLVVVFPLYFISLYSLNSLGWNYIETNNPGKITLSVRLID